MGTLRCLKAAIQVKGRYTPALPTVNFLAWQQTDSPGQSRPFVARVGVGELLRDEITAPWGWAGLGRRRCGAPEPDRHDPADDHIQRLQADARATSALQLTRRAQRTRRTQDVRAGEHAAVLVIGGKSTMFDLPRDPALQRLLVAHFEGGGALAAVCHGPAALAPLRRADGTALVARR